jgi:hypothetical protein
LGENYGEKVVGIKKENEVAYGTKEIGAAIIG